MEEKQGGQTETIRQKKEHSQGHGSKSAQTRSRREKEQIWREHLRKTLPPEEYQKYLEREKKRQLRTYLGAGIGAVLCLTVVGILGTKLVHTIQSGLKKPVSAEPTTTVEAEEQEENRSYPERDITLGSTGSMLLHSPFISSYPDAEGNYDFSSIFKYIAPYYSAPDFMTCEFEGALAGKEMGYSGYPNFKSPDAIVKNIRDSGVDLQMLATNHVYDAGSQAFHRAMEVYAENQIAYTGIRESEAEKPYYVADIDGVSVGFMDYVYETKGTGVNLNGIPVASQDWELVNSFKYEDLEPFYEEVSENIRDMKADGARFIVVNFHWGTEYQLTESEYQRKIAQKLCDLGVDALIGGHPHCLQPIDVFESEDGARKMFCIFSQGNALSNQRTYLMMNEMPDGHTEDGVLLTLSLHQDTEGKVTITGIDLLPTWVYRFQNNGSKYYILPLEDVDALPGKTGITDLGDDPKRSYDRTMEELGPGLDKARKAFGCE